MCLAIYQHGTDIQNGGSHLEKCVTDQNKKAPAADNVHEVKAFRLARKVMTHLF